MVGQTRPKHLVCSNERTLLESPFIRAKNKKFYFGEIDEYQHSETNLGSNR